MTYFVALAWVLAYAWLGLAGLGIVAGATLLADALFLAIRRLEYQQGRIVALERLWGWELGHPDWRRLLRALQDGIRR